MASHPKKTMFFLLNVVRNFLSHQTSLFKVVTVLYWQTVLFCLIMYRGADKSLAQPTSRCILFDGENISFDASLVVYINSTNIPPIMIINRMYETQNLLSL